jgi:DNA-binding transcriptional regulator YiaG
LSVTTTGLGITTTLALIVAPWAVPIEEPPSVPESAWIAFSDEVRQAGLGTATGKFTEKPKPTSDLSAVVAALKVESGLTADQLGRLLGVSRRSIHNWAAGSAIASTHEEKVRELDSFIASLPAYTPDERRALLLDSSNGPSLFKQFASRANHPQRIKFGVPVEERLGL